MDIRKMFMEKNSGLDIAVEFGPSGVLSRNIEKGQAVDLFISAGQKEIDRLADKGFILPDSRKSLVGNQMVVMLKKGLTMNYLADLTTDQFRNIVLPFPDKAPSGRYAKEMLIRLGLWDVLTEKQYFVDDVKQVVEAVAGGEADAGFAWYADIQATPGLDYYRIPQAAYEPVMVTAALPLYAEKNISAKKFLEYIASEEGIITLEKYGFTRPEQGQGAKRPHILWKFLTPSYEDDFVNALL